MTDTLSRPKLLVHERLLVLILCGGMLFLSLIALSNPYIPEALDDLPTPIESPTYITVTIMGAVANPGPYTLEYGATLHDLIEIASPSPSADMKNARMGSKLRDGQVVNVKEAGEKQVKSLGKDPKIRVKAKKK